MSDNKKSSKPKIPTKQYTVTREYLLDGKPVKVGSKVELTKEGAIAAIAKHRISKEEFDKLNTKK